MIHIHFSPNVSYFLLFQLWFVDKKFKFVKDNPIFKLFPKWQILDSTKVQEFADDYFKVDENGGKFSERVENTEGKEEIACYGQFLLFPQCFQKTCTADTGSLFGRVQNS